MNYFALTLQDIILFIHCCICIKVNAFIEENMLTCVYIWFFVYLFSQARTLEPGGVGNVMKRVFQLLSLSVILFQLSSFCFIESFCNIKIAIY